MNAPSSPVLAEQLQAQREQIFKAMAIIHVCHKANASLYESADPEEMNPVLMAAYDLLDAVAGELERFVEANAASAQDGDEAP